MGKRIEEEGEYYIYESCEKNIRVCIAFFLVFEKTGKTIFYTAF